MIVRSVVGKGYDFCGFAALMFLNRRFNPKTPARLMQCLLECISPPVVKDAGNLARAVEEWEQKRAELLLEFGEGLSDNLSVAVLVSMFPRDFQDMVFQLGSMGEGLKYVEVRDKVVSVAGHRVQMAQPVPMDVGALDWWGGESGEGGESEEGCFAAASCFSLSKKIMDQYIRTL